MYADLVTIFFKPHLLVGVGWTGKAQRLPWEHSSRGKEGLGRGRREALRLWTPGGTGKWGGRSQLEQGGPRGVCRVKNEMQGRGEQFSSGE